MKNSISLFLVSILMLASGAVFAGQKDYVTWTGIGPDKWASAWLITRHIDPGASIRIIPTGTPPTGGIPFDIPEASSYYRNASHTAYERLIEGYGIDSGILIKIGKIIRDIEVNYWGGQQSVAAPFVEAAFRGLQFKYGRESVPQSCYFQLFDHLHGYLAENAGQTNISTLQNLELHDSSCGSVQNVTVASDKKLVNEWKPLQLLSFIDAGDKVVFIDTRESDEYEEGHIPGAINLQLRKIVGGPLPDEVINADVVVPYCVKDFRAFEVAKRLKRMGIKNVGLINPWGISGWKATGLPVSGSRGLTENDASQRMQDCINKPAECINA